MLRMRQVHWYFTGEICQLYSGADFQGHAVTQFEDGEHCDAAVKAGLSQHHSAVPKFSVFSLKI